MTTTPPPDPDPAHRAGGTRQAEPKGPAGWWGKAWPVALLFLAVLTFLVIFLVQNPDEVRVHFLGLDGRMPLGVAMLLSALGGALLVSVAAAARIWQLRRISRTNRQR